MIEVQKTAYQDGKSPDAEVTMTVFQLEIFRFEMYLK